MLPSLITICWLLWGLGGVAFIYTARLLQQQHGKNLQECLERYQDHCCSAPWPNAGMNALAMLWMRQCTTKVVATSAQALASGRTAFLLSENWAHFSFEGRLWIFLLLKFQIFSLLQRIIIKASMHSSPASSPVLCRWSHPFWHLWSNFKDNWGQCFLHLHSYTLTHTHTNTPIPP